MTGLIGDGQWDAGLVRVARVVADLHDGDPPPLVDLRGGKARTVRFTHGVDEVVDQLLHLVTGDRIDVDGVGDDAQRRVTDRQHVANGHCEPTSPPARVHSIGNNGWSIGSPAGSSRSRWSNGGDVVQRRGACTMSSPR